MKVVDKMNWLGCISILLLFLIQLNSNFWFDANFDKYQNERKEIVAKQLVQNGFSDQQANAIENLLRDEVRMLNSSMFSRASTQSFATAMTCLCILGAALHAIKKNRNE